MPLLEILTPRVLDGNGDPASGATVKVYTAGTTTPVTTYSNAGLSVAHAWPVVADSVGLFPAIYVPGGSYKAVIAESDGSALVTFDNIDTETDVYLEKAGDTATGPMVFTGVVAHKRTGVSEFFSFYRTDADAATMAGAQFKHFGGADDCVRLTELDNTGAEGSAFARWDPAGTTSPSTLTVLTREKADARFAPISSDASLKQNIADMPAVGSVVDGLQPRTYQWIQDATDPRPTGTRYGMIAQEVEAVFSAGVLPAGDGLVGLDPLSLIALLVKEVQSLRGRVAALEV